MTQILAITAHDSVRPHRDMSAIVQAAYDAFWSKVAELCPDIKTGDLYPGIAQLLERDMTKAVISWVEVNEVASSTGTAGCETGATGDGKSGSGEKY